MYVIIRRLTQMRSVSEAARRAESGIGQMLRQAPGFRGYYVFDAGNGVGGSVTLFESREEALAANDKALAWIRASLRSRRAKCSPLLFPDVRLCPGVSLRPRPESYLHAAPDLVREPDRLNRSQAS